MTKTTGVKLCKDCIHCVPAEFRDNRARYEYAKCNRWLSKVDGKPSHYCSMEREPNNGFFGGDGDSCGPSGRFWVAKDNIIPIASSQDS